MHFKVRFQLEWDICQIISTKMKYNFYVNLFKNYID